MVSKAIQAISWPVFRPREWGKGSLRNRELPRPWYGLDTERDSKTGEFVCGWIVGEDTKSFRFMDALGDGTYFVWNLAYDVEGMLRDLADDAGWCARRDGSSFELRGEEACYYHGKIFRYGGRRFLEASSFFGKVPLSKMGAKEHIDASKISLEKYQRNEEYRRDVPIFDAVTGQIVNWKPGFELGRYRDDIDSYCRQDARIVYDRMTALQAGLEPLGIALASTPGGTARRFIGKLGSFPPVVWATHKAFLRCYSGGRFELTKRGVVHNASQYDLISAYPWALSLCPWLTSAAYQRSTRRFSDNALYGSYRISFSWDGYLGVAPTWKKNIRVYSSAEENIWLARPEVGWLLQNGARIEIHEGLEIFDENASDTWNRAILELFELKKVSKNGPDGGWGAKIVLNSEYGVLIQLIRKSGEWVRLEDATEAVDWVGDWAYTKPPEEFEGGKYFAPVYASHLTSLVRTRLLDVGLIIGDKNYVGGHTDSVVTLGSLATGSNLGDWELKDQAPRADLSKTGMYAIGDCVRMRGITRKGNAKLLWEPEHQRKTRIGIKSAKSWDEVSVILPKTVANNFAVEQKRRWDADITPELIAREGFIDSLPWSYVTKLK